MARIFITVRGKKIPIDKPLNKIGQEAIATAKTWGKAGAGIATASVVKAGILGGVGSIAHVPISHVVAGAGTAVMVRKLGRLYRSAKAARSKIPLRRK
jgi:hypothetical protein